MNGETTKILHLFSGGLDSTVMLYDMINDGCLVHCLSYYYGQEHIIEIDKAKLIASDLGIKITTMDLSHVFKWSTSDLHGGSGGVVVPNRNAIFIHSAVPLAIALDSDTITIGATKDDYEFFMDCRREFFGSIQESLQISGIRIEIKCPYALRTKREIITLGKRLKVPFHKTWSCYKRGRTPCGECLACVTRQKAFDDPS